jgi:hypothetical protein
MVGEPEMVGGPEMIEFGEPPTGPRPTRAAPVVVAAVLAGLVVGFLIGRHQPATETTARPTTTPSPAFLDAIIATGHTCSTTRPGPGGHDDLQLGVEITNRSTIPVTLRDAQISLPLGGLQTAGDPVLQACGELTNPTALVSQTLLPGQTTWYSVRMHVPDGQCPVALPVLFHISYRFGSAVRLADVGGFDDLSGVPYPSCSGT